MTLRDGRPFAVFSVQTHVARGKCHIRENRWGEKDAICDVITGYTLVGRAPDGLPTVVSVPPDEISSVECVIIGPADMPDPSLTGNVDQGDEDNGEDRPVPFGFARWVQDRETPNVEEVDDPSGSLKGS